ncbi:MAG: radical SAM protein [Alphaproteobacteria bacterium]|nr:radical SAM protein [Alphaproteobacteria bacterium]
MSAVESLSFGCRLNALEAALLARAPEYAGKVVVNTCAVTAEAEAQARQAIRRLARERPDSEIVVTGCAATLRPEAWRDLPGVRAVVPNARKLAGASQRGARLLARAYLEIQNGCDHACTFCAIAAARGPSRSLSLESAVAEARRLVAEGANELVLTGVDLTAWGEDLEGRPRLGDLVAALLDRVRDLPRLRLSSLDVAEIDPALESLIVSAPRLMPHLHLSLQSGDDLILKRMKRRHDRAQAVAFCRRIKAARPEIALGADLIAGFPTEDEAAFDNTLRLIADCDLTWLHVFPFSPRPGTPAARMPAPEPGVAHDRAARLRAAGHAAIGRHLDRVVGREVELVMENANIGRAPDYVPVLVDRPAEIGALLRVRISARAGDRLLGSVMA